MGTFEGASESATTGLPVGTFEGASESATTGLPVGTFEGASESSAATAAAFGQIWTPDVPDVMENFVALVYHPPTKIPFDNELLSPPLVGFPIVS